MIACGGTPTRDPAAAPPPDVASGAPAAPGAATPTSSRRGYILLADGSFRTFDDGIPSTAYVEGTLDSGAFVPDGDVRGGEGIEATGTAGWLELMDGSFYPAQSERLPRRPYIDGFMGQDGLFRPAARQVQY